MDGTAAAVLAATSGSWPWKWPNRAESIDDSSFTWFQCLVFALACSFVFFVVVGGSLTIISWIKANFIVSSSDQLMFWLIVMTRNWKVGKKKMKKLENTEVLVISARSATSQIGFWQHCVLHWSLTLQSTCGLRTINSFDSCTFGLFGFVCAFEQFYWSCWSKNKVYRV